MSNSRTVRVWFGIVAIVAGVALLLSGVFTAEKAQASRDGISITIVRPTSSK